MAEPTVYSFQRYLAAKKSLDDRSLNRQVWDTMARSVLARQASSVLQVLEAGCGSGTMLERLLARRVLTRAAYTGVDLDPENLAAARERLQSFAAAQGASLGEEAGTLVWRQRHQQVAIRLTCADIFVFAREPRPSWDLLLAHALLDLLDVPAVLPLLLSLLTRGGCYYFTLNFDGVTVLQPAVDPHLDRLIETLYHLSMDERRRQGKPSGDSQTGRHLFQHLQAAGGTLLAAGSSDWVVAPLEGRYLKDEAYFLHHLIDTIRQALEGHPLLDKGAFQTWVEERHGQIERRQLVYIAHQLDFFGYI